VLQFLEGYFGEMLSPLVGEECLDGFCYGDGIDLNGD
jgi:hypothetical protein